MKSKNKIDVIFLDIDGVLNTVPGFLYWESVYKNKKRPKDIYEGKAPYRLDPTKVAIFNKMLDEIAKNGTDIKVVISSSWRLLYPTLKGLKGRLKKDGLNVDFIWDKTGYPKMSSWRGHVIDWYMGDLLKERGIEINKYMIIDDNSDFFGEQLDNFTRTNSKDGLSMQNVVDIVEHFKSEEQKAEEAEEEKKRLELLRCFI